MAPHGKSCNGLPRAHRLYAGPASLQAGALCGAPQSSGVEHRVRADAGAAPSTPDGAAALVAARLLGAKCVREAIGHALTELQGMRAAVAAGNAAPAPQRGPEDAATNDPAAPQNKQPGPTAAADHSTKADGAAAVGAGTAHRDKRQRREATTPPDQPPAGTASGLAAEPVLQVGSDDDYMGDVSDVSMSDEEGNEPAAQRRKGAALLGGGLGSGAAAGGAGPSRPETATAAASPQARQPRESADGERPDRPSNKQKKAKPVQKPKNRYEAWSNSSSGRHTIGSCQQS